MSSESKDLLRDEEDLPASETTRGASYNFVCVSVLVLLVLGTVVALAAGLIHAQCSVIWTINIPCFDVSSLLVNQIKEWTTESCPSKNQKCRYSLVAVSDNDIVAMHTTSVVKFVEDIIFNFSSPNSDSCEIKGHSASRCWYAILDSGANYMNMYNLMKVECDREEEGAGCEVDSGVPAGRTVHEEAEQIKARWEGRGR